MRSRGQHPVSHLGPCPAQFVERRNRRSRDDAVTWARLPFPVALFISNVASIVILNYLVPWTATRFAWWLQPKGKDTGSTDIKGYLLLAAACAVMVVIFTLYA